MGRPPKELDIQVVKDIILSQTIHSENKIEIPTTADIRDAYEERTGDGVHRKTVRNFLLRHPDEFTLTQVSDYMGWRVSD